MNQRKIEEMVELVAPLLLLASGMAAIFVSIHQALKSDSNHGFVITPELVDKMRDGAMVVYKIEDDVIYHATVEEC